MTTPIRAPRAPVPGYLRALRVTVAGLSAAAAVVYLQIGLEILRVEHPGTSDPGLLWFGIAAAAAYLFGAFVILVSNRMLLWLAGAFVQVFAIFAYVGLPDGRTPLHEFWGTTLRVVQSLILLALVVLISRYPQPERFARLGLGPRRRGAGGP